MYKLEEKIFFDGMQQVHGTVAFSSLCTGQPAGIAFIDSLAADMAPVIADINARRLEFIKINSEHGFNQVADYVIDHSELNLVHAISRDNTGHLILDDNAITAAFDAVHSELFKSWNSILTEDNTHCVNVIISGAGAVSINTPVLFACSGRNFTFGSASDGCGLELVLNSTYADITITVNGMMSRSEAVRLAAANAVRRFYVDAEISVNRLNVNLIDGHAGTGNDGRNAANNFVLNNAIAGKKSADGVSFLTTETQRHREPLFYHEGHEGNETKTALGYSFFVLSVVNMAVPRFIVPILTPDSCLLTSVSKNNKNNIFEAITLRCANVST